jgi:hypothetical protein
MRSELYAALKQAGASDAVATSVAEEVAALDARVVGLEGRVKVLTVGFGLALGTALVILMLK